MRPQPSQASIGGSQLLQHEAGSVSILHIGRVDPHAHQQALRIDDQVPLAARDFLARVVASGPPFSVVFTDWESTTPALG